MRGRLPIRVNKIADEYFTKVAQKTLGNPQPQPPQQPQQAPAAPAPAAPPAPAGGGFTTPVPSTMDRTHDMREMIRNFVNVAKLAKSKAKVLKELLENNDSSKILDDPQYWDDKKWADVVKATERLVRDTNQALLTLDEEGKTEMPDQGQDELNEQAGPMQEDSMSQGGM